MQWKRGFIVHRVSKRIAAHIAGAVFCGTKGGKRVLIQLVDGCAGQTKEERVRQRLAHAHTEITLLRAMGLIDHEDDIIAIVERLGDLGKFKYLSDDDLAGIRLQQPRQLRAGICWNQIRHVRHGECTENLPAQVNAVIDDYDCRRIQLLHHAQLLCGKDH